MSSAASAAAYGAVEADTRARATATPRSRIASIDVMRGLVIVLMLMDHVRERFFLHVQVTDPMDVDDHHARALLHPPTRRTSAHRSSSS